MDFPKCLNNIGYIEDCLNYGVNYFFDTSTGDCNNFGHQIVCIHDLLVPSIPQKLLISRKTYEKIKISPPDYDTEICVGYEDGEIFGIEGSCSKYYYCVDQTGYLDDCKNFGPEFQYDVKINDCNYKSDVKCDESMDIFK